MDLKTLKCGQIHSEVSELTSDQISLWISVYIYGIRQIYAFIQTDLQK